jgi:hypothetical protein
MTSLYKTETRHHPSGGTCHHFAFHGLTCDEYDALRARANGRCEICGIAEEDTPRGVLVVDHFEEKGVRFIRGMICGRCNSGVMSCIDGRKVWGANRRWEAKAREYEANSWEKPSPEALALIDARTEKLPRKRALPRPVRARVNAICIPSRQGVPAMAVALRRWLSPDELAELASLLGGDVPDA